MNEEQISHYIQSQLDIANAKIIEQEKEIEDWKFTKKYVEDNYIHKEEIKAKIKGYDGLKIMEE